MIVFLAYPYREEAEAFAKQIHDLLEALDVEVVDGKWPDASIPLRDDIVGRIKSCEVLTSLTFSGIPSPWADVEVGIALTNGIDVITLTDADAPRGAEHFHISRTKGDMFVATELANTIRLIKQRRYATSVPSLSVNTSLEEYETETWQPEVLNLLAQFRPLWAQSQFKQALVQSKLAREQYPECWRFFIAESAALIHLTKLDLADKCLRDVIARFPDEPRALSYANDNLAWSLSRSQGGESRKSLFARRRLLAQALQHEERVEPYVSLVYCLLKLNQITEAENRFIRFLEKFPTEIGTFRARVRLHGSEFIQAVAKSHLICALLFPTLEVESNESTSHPNVLHRAVYHQHDQRTY